MNRNLLFCPQTYLCRQKWEKELPLEICKIIFSPNISVSFGVGALVSFHQLQLTMKGLAKLINSEVLIPNFRSISPPPNQKKSGLSFTIASSKITWNQQMHSFQVNNCKLLTTILSLYKNIVWSNIKNIIFPTKLLDQHKIYIHTYINIYIINPNIHLQGYSFGRHDI